MDFSLERLWGRALVTRNKENKCRMPRGIGTEKKNPSHFPYMFTICTYNPLKKNFLKKYAIIHPLFYFFKEKKWQLQKI